MANRLVELAIEALEARKAAIDEEIGRLRRELRPGRRTRTNPSGPAGRRKKGGMSAAARKAQSLRMKEYWARKRAAAGQAGTRRRTKP
jgi:hypothetical protein